MKILDFYEYIYDRQTLLRRKQRYPNNPEIWTTDPVLKKYSFCNVRRYDDAGTQHLISHVINNKNLTPDDVLFNTIMYRFFNVRNFFTEILGAPLSVHRFDFRETLEYMDTAKEKGIPLFSNAYMICGIPYVKERKEDKHFQVLARMNDLSINPNFYKILKMRDAWQIFKALPYQGHYNLGEFLAYQILLDWSYYKALDHMREMNYCGPGTIYTLKKLYPRRSVEDALTFIFENQEMWFKELKKKTGKDWEKLNGKEISITDIENCCCEFRKYWKIKHGITQRKRYYNAVS